METVEALRSLLRDVEAELDETNRRAERVSAELRDLTEARVLLSNEITVLKRAVERRGVVLTGQDSLLGPDELMERNRGISGHDARGLARTDAVEFAVERLVAERNSPVGPTDVAYYLRRLGRDDRVEVISAAMAHLKNSGRIHRVGQGQWLPGPENAETPVLAGVSGPDREEVTRSRQEGVGYVPTPLQKGHDHDPSIQIAGGDA
ncbi:MAG: hypothetical protein Q7V58_16340 [Actinomycetota bacterium]|nr:hypothetical protein [Actinomycetota bacterium]